MKILVTGATGHVGKVLVQQLENMKLDFRVAGTNEEKLEGMFGVDIDKVRFDFLDSSTFEPALKDVNRVFLMRPPHLGEPKDLYPFIDAVKNHDIELICFLSLMGVENNPIPPHHKIEKYIEDQKIPYAHIRPGFFMQNLSGIHAKEIKEDHSIFVPAGKSKTSFIDAKDIGLAIATIFKHPQKHKNKAYTLTGPKALTYDEVAKILTDVLGYKITYNKPSFLEYRSHYIKDRNFDKAYVNVTVALYLMTRLGTAKKVTSDFYKLTGKPATEFKEFALENREAFV